MTIAEWLKEEGRKLNWLAERVGCSVDYLSAIKRGVARPSKFMAKAIQQATNDGVPASQWHPGLK